MRLRQSNILKELRRDNETINSGARFEEIEIMIKELEENYEKNSYPLLDKVEIIEQEIFRIDVD